MNTDYPGWLAIERVNEFMRSAILRPPVCKLSPRARKIACESAADQAAEDPPARFKLRSQPIRTASKDAATVGCYTSAIPRQIRSVPSPFHGAETAAVRFWF